MSLLVAATASLLGCKDPPSQNTSAPAPSQKEALVAPSVAPPVASPSATASKPEEPPPTKIAAQHLLVAFKGAASVPKGVTRSKEEARKRVEEAARRAKAGEDFSALVAEYSDDATKANRGNLGVFTREKMDKAFSDAAFALPLDGVSGVVETKYGFHVIKRNQ